jgi:hypothetical protein
MAALHPMDAMFNGYPPFRSIGRVLCYNLIDRPTRRLTLWDGPPSGDPVSAFLVFPSVLISWPCL